MNAARFGRTERVINRPGLGCMGMSHIYGQADDAESIATIQEAIDLGVQLLDTSASYGSGHNQELIGKAIKGRQDKVLVHCKFGSRRNASGQSVSSSASIDTAREDCEDALRRLGVEAVDIMAPSRIDPDVPVEETVGALARLVEAGKLRHVGLSEAGVESIRRANAVHPIASLQMEYSLLTRDYEADHKAVCAEYGMALMAYAPFGRGLLTGMFESAATIPDDDRRPRDFPRFQEGNLEKNLALVEKLRGLAGAKEHTPAQIALAWTMAQGEEIFPIPGAKSRDHMRENVAAASVDLSPEEIADLNGWFAPENVAGDRYGERGMGRINR